VTSSGLIVVDKPSGMTSHDVVARVRRIAGTRRVGHAGTLDPMATGVLVVGVERATRLLTYIIGCDKGYTATIRLGQSTLTDDAEGEVVRTAPPESMTRLALPDSAIISGLAGLTGQIDQIPSAVSAIKVRGVRSYARVRAGEDVELAARRVTVASLIARAITRTEQTVDVNVEVTCSSGTYIRAIARDLGVALGVGGHVTALRRTAVGGFLEAEAVSLDDLAGRPDPVLVPLADATARLLPRREISDLEAKILAHGGPLDARGVVGPYAVFDPEGAVIAIVVERDGRARPAVVFAPA
jgi:tRNA pseudouridine55 synthase